MRDADQIEDIGRRSGDKIANALRDYAGRRAMLVKAARPSWAATESATRDRLRREADLCDTGSPRILLPADVASGSPHSRRR